VLKLCLYDVELRNHPLLRGDAPDIKSSAAREISAKVRESQKREGLGVWDGLVHRGELHINPPRKGANDQNHNPDDDVGQPAVTEVYERFRRHGFTVMKRHSANRFRHRLQSPGRGNF
jgi:hypothetical protein